MNKDNVAEKWREEFDDMFTASNYPIPFKTLQGSPDAVKSFIADLLTSHRLSLKEELMKKLPMEKECDYLPETCAAKTNGCIHDGFDSCLSQVKESLTSIFKEK